MAAALETKSKDQKSREKEASPRPLPAGARRNWRWATAGLVLVLGGAAGAVALTEARMQRVPVVVLAHDVPAGHVLSATDFQIAELAGVEGLGLVRADGGAVEGRRLAVPVRAGTPLAEAALADEADWPEPGSTVVAVSLPGGEVPAAVVPGARVAVMAVGEEPEDSGEPVVAQVHSRTGSDTVDEVAVELEVPVEHMAPVVRAAAAQELRLVLVWPDRGSSGDESGGRP